jgi:hypothetical protein
MLPQTSSIFNGLRTNEIETLVDKHYKNLLPGVNACLAVFGAMSLKGRTKPLSLMFEAGSGFGKSATVQMAFPLPGSGLNNHVYRSDKFTPKSFVTHAANVAEKDLAKMDLLPKLENRVLITKEMAPLFRGRIEELQDNFSILIAVLDGKGFLSDTGMRGQRGYDRSIIFNWIGATTPLPARTHRLMSQLGTRLLFFELPAFEITDEQLLTYAEHGDPGHAENECQRVMNDFLVKFYEANPVASVDPNSIDFPQPLLKHLIRWAKFLTHGRAEIKFDQENKDWKPVAANPPEAPFKVVTYFKDLALGHALINGRSFVDHSDIDLVGQIALSSIPGHLRPIVRELRCGQVMTPRVSKLCSVTATTARSYMVELDLLGIADLAKACPASNQADSLVLSQKYEWLKSDLNR